jgi:hypothetical protein
VNKDKKIELITTANQDTPVALGAKAIIGVDVWEHAYYLNTRTAGRIISSLVERGELGQGAANLKKARRNFAASS